LSDAVLAIALFGTVSLWVADPAFANADGGEGCGG
jgi:hypothetical protein